MSKHPMIVGFFFSVFAHNLHFGFSLSGLLGLCTEKPGLVGPDLNTSMLNFAQFFEPMIIEALLHSS